MINMNLFCNMIYVVVKQKKSQLFQKNELHDINSLVSLATQNPNTVVLSIFAIYENILHHNYVVQSWMTFWNVPIKHKYHGII